MKHPLHIAAFCSLFLALSLTACAPQVGPSPSAHVSQGTEAEDVSERSADTAAIESAVQSEPAASAPAPHADDLKAALDLTEDYRASFVHGEKPARYQRYIVLHDTEGEADASGVVDYWDGNGAGVAAHFIVNKDGSIVQCVPLDKIAHHAGFGDTGHNELFGIVEDGRDDLVGTVPIGSCASDYAMNAWSVGIEMVHVGGSGPYPEEQLEAVDTLVAFIDASYGFESEIIDHKAWRSGNSDTSPEFAEHLANYQSHRTHGSGGQVH